MKFKGILVLLLCALSISVCYSKKSSHKDKNEKLAWNLQTLYYDFSSSSLLWQSLAHYFNRSELVLPGYSHVFREFSKLDRQHAYRAMELTGMRGFKFTDRRLNTRDIITNAISTKKDMIKKEKKKNFLEEAGMDKNKANKIIKKLSGKKKSGLTKTEKKRLAKAKKVITYYSDLEALNKLAGKFPGCSQVNITEDDLKDEIEPYLDGAKNYGVRDLPRAYSILKFAQLIEDCHMTINIDQWKADAHLNYVIRREFVTEQVNRGKIIADLLTKLYGGDRWVEFVNDKILRTAALQY